MHDSGTAKGTGTRTRGFLLKQATRIENNYLFNVADLSGRAGCIHMNGELK